PPVLSPCATSYFGVSDTKHRMSIACDLNCPFVEASRRGKQIPWMQMMHQIPPQTLEIGRASTHSGPIMLTEPSDSAPKQPAEMPLLPIDRQTSLGELAYTSLKEAIVRGEFSAGTKLTVRAVAQALSVSTTPARDAIMRLIGEGTLVN